MDQQAIDVTMKHRALSNRADVRFLRLKEVLAICGKSRSSVYDAIKKGDFPKPVKLSGRSSAWGQAKWNGGRSNAFALADRVRGLDTGCRLRMDLVGSQTGTDLTGKEFVMTKWSEP